MDIGVSYPEDVDEVIEVIRDIGMQLREDEIFAKELLDDIEVQGLQRFDDSAVIRARFKTKPRRQWIITREFNRRLKIVSMNWASKYRIPHAHFWRRQKRRRKTTQSSPRNRLVFLQYKECLRCQKVCPLRPC